MVIGSIPLKHRIKCSWDQFRGNTESHGHRIGSVEKQNQMIIWSIPWKHELPYVSQRKTSSRWSCNILCLHVRIRGRSCSVVRVVSSCCHRDHSWCVRVLSSQWSSRTHFSVGVSVASTSTCGQVSRWLVSGCFRFAFSKKCSCWHRGHPWCFRALCWQWSSRTHFDVGFLSH